jgi:8-oxo-dGTP pyrophosphatase MutT (NUDIX family)
MNVRQTSSENSPGRWSEQGFIDKAVTELLPPWLTPLVESVPLLTTHDVTRFRPAPGDGRHAAVLILLGDGPDVLLIERAGGNALHSGQPAFPGGAVEPTDAGAVHAALREAEEETGVDPAGVRVFGALPDLWLPVSDFVVSPVLGHWREPSEVAPQDPREVSRVERVAIDELIDPDNRWTVLHPSGYRGPGFQVRNMLVWGFTAGILDALLDRAGWTTPWDEAREVVVER